VAGRSGRTLAELPLSRAVFGWSACVIALQRLLRGTFVLTLRQVKWLPPSLGISPSYARGIGIAALLLAVHIWHVLGLAILRRGELARRSLCSLDRGHDVFSSPAVLPAAARTNRVRSRGSLRVVTLVLGHTSGRASGDSE
jgi:hypothetical protein